jgi:uncharacterized protein (DUF58 family)
VRIPFSLTARGKANIARLWTRSEFQNSTRARLSERDWHQFDRLALVTRRPATAGPGGEHRSRLRTPAIDFFDHRAYQVGDDPRWIDWNVYGRLGTLQVKVTEAEERLHLFLVLDCSASMDWGEPSKLDRAVEAIAALAYVGLRQAAVVRIVCLGQQPRALGPVTGRTHFPEVIRFLTSVEPDGQVALAEALSRIPATLPRGAHPTQPLVVLVSDLLVADPGSLGDACDALLREGADLAVIHVLSPQEEAPDPLGEVELVDAETGEILDIGLNLAAITAYRDRLSTWLGDIERLCAQRGLRYARVRTDRSIQSLLIEDLRRAQLLR